MDFPKHWVILVTFALTIFVSASLLFVVQPMVGKMILPHLGGSSSVWTTCMLFFQTMLVAGYGYAHVIAQKMSARRQVVVHLALIAVAIAVSLPFSIPEELLRTQSSPALWLLLALLVAVGLPLFIVSSSAPLFQHWFGFTDHPDADDPYYLYAASNIGSLLALFGYPFFVERMFAIGNQSRLWAWGFGVLAALAVACGVCVFKWHEPADSPDQNPASPNDAEVDDESTLTWKRRGWWLLITFIPSSLMLGVTHYMTTDLASVPLLWVLPLGLYLLSFIIVFARLPIRLWVFRMVLPAATLVVLALTFASYLSMAMLVIGHLWVFFLYAMYFHGELAADRPDTTHLTEFYIWMSVGGALGGLFNALLAPMLFDWMVEYYLVLALGLGLVLPIRTEEQHRTRFNVIGAAVVLTLSVAVFFWGLGDLTPGGFATGFGMVVVVATLVGMSLSFPRAQNVALGVILLVGSVLFQHVSSAEVYKRSFFATYAVYTDYLDDYPVRVFSHGTTQHGIQVLEDGYRFEKVGYYHPLGPVGDIFEAIPNDRVAVAGLGTGAMAPYTQPDTEMVFFEIDPVVEEIAREHFTYLDRCGDLCTVEIGDARNLIERAELGAFDIIMMDAYSSDSVPTHLLTKESVELYMSRTASEGVVLFHVSNRYLDVEGVVGAIADELGYVARTRSYQPAMQDNHTLAYGSTFTVVAREESDIRELIESPRWNETSKADVVWTDDFTNIVSVFKW